MLKAVAFMPEPDRSRTWLPMNGMVAGLRRHGVKVRQRRVGVDAWEAADVLVINGWIKPGRAHTPIIEAQLAAGLPLLVVDQGYLQPKAFWSAGWNGLNGRADFRNSGSPPDRWRQVGKRLALKPWRTAGDAIVLMGQVPLDAALGGTDIDAWAAATVLALRQHTGRPILFRPHPRSKFEHLIPGATTTTAELDLLLATAWAAVTFNSSVAVESLLAGVPVFATDCGSVAWPLANKDLASIEAPATPKRQQWLHDLAYAQWAPSEMAAGLTWEHLKGGVT